MKRTLVKSKIVLSTDGNSTTVYLWKRLFGPIGYWYPFGVRQTTKRLKDNDLSHINDDHVSAYLHALQTKSEVSSAYKFPSLGKAS